MKKQRVIKLLALFAALFALVCSSKDRIFEKGFFGLDTYITVKIVCGKKSLAEELQKRIVSEA
jgi:hypothetical protein